LNKEKLSKDIYKEDVDKMMIEIMEVIDKHVGYEWSGTKKSDEYYDKFENSLEELFNSPDYRNCN